MLPTFPYVPLCSACSPMLPMFPYVVFCMFPYVTYVPLCCVLHVPLCCVLHVPLCYLCSPMLCSACSPMLPMFPYVVFCMFPCVPLCFYLILTRSLVPINTSCGFSYSHQDTHKHLHHTHKVINKLSYITEPKHSKPNPYTRISHFHIQHTTLRSSFKYFSLTTQRNDYTSINMSVNKTCSTI